MPSHLKEDQPRPSDVSLLDVRGDGHADLLAGEAAAEACIPNSIAVPYVYYVKLVKRIQRSLATVLIYSPSREKVPKKPKESIPNLESLYQTTNTPSSGTNSE
jgi:hypothetical protein